MQMKNQNKNIDEKSPFYLSQKVIFLKDFCCNICNKRVASWSSLQRHIRNHHPHEQTPHKPHLSNSSTTQTQHKQPSFTLSTSRSDQGSKSKQTQHTTLALTYSQPSRTTRRTTHEQKLNQYNIYSKINQHYTKKDITKFAIFKNLHDYLEYKDSLKIDPKTKKLIKEKNQTGRLPNYNRSHWGILVKFFNFVKTYEDITTISLTPLLCPKRLEYFIKHLQRNYKNNTINNQLSHMANIYDWLANFGHGLSHKDATTFNRHKKYCLTVANTHRWLYTVETSHSRSETDKVNDGSFLDPEEAKIFFRYILEEWIEKKKNFEEASTVNKEKCARKMQDIIITLVAILSGGQRRQVISNLTIDSFTIINELGGFGTKIQKEKQDRAHGGIIPMNNQLVGFIQYFLTYIRPALKPNKGVIAQWINQNGNAMKQETVTNRLTRTIKEFDKGLSINFLELRRWFISCTMKDISTNKKERDIISSLELYLNTSSGVIEKHYDRSTKVEQIRKVGQEMNSYLMDMQGLNLLASENQKAKNETDMITVESKQRKRKIRIDYKEKIWESQIPKEKKPKQKEKKLKSYHHTGGMTNSL